LTFKRKIFEWVTDVLICLLGLNKASWLVCNFHQKISPTFKVIHKNRLYLLHCPNVITRYRAKTFFTKEPETIDWINTFSDNEVLFDVGANVGLYSIYAASRGIKVFAFEPEAQNYALLNRNIYINHLSDQIISLNVAFSDNDGINFLFMPQFQAGSALNNLGEAKDFHHRVFQPCFKQSVISYTVDSFLARNHDFFPNHLKIDVDGLEAKIINGAKNTLSDRRLKSVLIEVNEALPEDCQSSKKIENNGFKLLYKRQSALAGQGEFKSLFNYIFIRDH
jgi:FkbM family methyltransferase